MPSLERLSQYSSISRMLKSFLSVLGRRASDRGPEGSGGAVIPPPRAAEADAAVAGVGVYWGGTLTSYAGGEVVAAAASNDN